MTDVTIRGIDDDVYSRFAAEAKKRGIPIGELATKAMNDLVLAAQAPSYHLENLEHLSVSRGDLESIDGPIIFSGIEVLEFEDDFRLSDLPSLAPGGHSSDHPGRIHPDLGLVGQDSRLTDDPLAPPVRRRVRRVLVRVIHTRRDRDLDRDRFAHTSGSNLNVRRNESPGRRTVSHRSSASMSTS